MTISASALGHPRMNDDFDDNDRPSAHGRVKMADIARMAGVSVSSVSRALAGSPLIPAPLRERIHAIAREQGYVVNQAARPLRLQTTRTIGLILPLGHEVGHPVSDPFLLELIGALADEVIARGYDLLLSKVTTTQDGWLHELTRSQRFDGLLVLGQSDQHAALNDVARDYPGMVVWGDFVRGQRYCTVGVNNAACGRRATEHMLKGGCRDLVFLGPSGVPESDARYEGYAQALAESEFRVAEPVQYETRFLDGAAVEVVRDLIAQRYRFDGLVCASDVIAQGAIKALAEGRLRVPQDVAVCGFDDVAAAQTLGLTTVRQDRVAGARHMVDLLFRRMSGEVAPPLRLPADLVVRQTTRPVA